MTKSDELIAAKSSAAPAHTPLPWKLKDGSIVGHREDGRETQVALLITQKWGTSLIYDTSANGQLIVRACNAHQALYEALSAAVSEIQAFYDAAAEGRIKTVVSVGQFARLEKMRAALADAAQGEK